MFRREGTQLSDIILRSQQIIGDNNGRMVHSGSSALWSGLPGGRRLQLLGVKDESDVKKHQGRPADLFVFDEATEFTEYQIRFITAWNRSTVPHQRCRVLLCFNPPTTPEGRWILDYFAPWLKDDHPNPAKPGELRWFATLPGGKEIERPNGKSFIYKLDDGTTEEIFPRSRTFIPARTSDNSYLADSGYIGVLQGLPEPLRSQLLKGDFKAGIKDDPWQVIPTKWVQMAQARWLARHKVRPGPPKGIPLEAVGVDVARGGDAQTVLAPRYGTWFGELQKHPGTTTPDGPAVATLVINCVGDSKAYVNLDVVGIGSSAFDSCVAAGVTVYGVNNSSKPTEGYTDRSGKLRFVNKRSENFWRLREALEPTKGDDLELPPDPQMLADLTAAKWKMTTRGVQIEAKEEIVGRLGRSVDAGDAVINSHAPPEMEYVFPDVNLGSTTQQSGWKNR